MSDPQYKYCSYEVDGAILTLTIDRPEVLNALHPEGHFELADAFDRYAADSTLRVAIITGAGDRAFCVGTDVKALAATKKDQVKPREGVRLLELYESQMLNKTYLNIEPKNARKQKASGT